MLACLGKYRALKVIRCRDLILLVGRDPGLERRRCANRISHSALYRESLGPRPCPKMVVQGRD